MGIVDNASIIRCHLLVENAWIDEVPINKSKNNYAAGRLVNQSPKQTYKQFKKSKTLGISYIYSSICRYLAMYIY